MVVDPNGKIVILSTGNQGGKVGIRLLRLDSTGINDAAFGNNIVPGVALHLDSSATAFSPRQIYLYGTGYIITGVKEGSGSICRIGTGGQLLGYIALPGFESVNKVTELSDGTLLIGGTGGKKVRLTRMLADGQLDESFGNAGIVSADYFGDNTTLVDLVAQSTNEVWVLSRIRKDLNGEEMGLLKLKVGEAVAIRGNSTQHLDVFPNPVDRYTMMVKGVTEADNITFVDLSGRPIPVSTSKMEAGSMRLEILGHPKPGIYFLHVDSPKGNQVLHIQVR
jgi:hypothetical protein